MPTYKSSEISTIRRSSMDLTAAKPGNTGKSGFHEGTASYEKAHQIPF